MEGDSVETVAPVLADETSVDEDEEETTEEYQRLSETISEYVNTNRNATNTQLFSFLALLNAYVPDSCLLMSECQKVLGPPDPIDGGPPFDERMKPFTALINTSKPRPGHVCIINSATAQEVVELLDQLGITRSATTKNFMSSLCSDQIQPHIMEFIKDLLTKREKVVNGKKKFSRLIEDIQKKNFYHAVSVLKMASLKFEQNFMFPLTLSRLWYVGKNTPDYEEAEKWAHTAIERAPRNSFVADTLGQIYKILLMREAQQPLEILDMADKALTAFKKVEEKAENEEGQEMEDIAGAVSLSAVFNNRGLFGFIRVAKIAFEKLRAEQKSWVESKKMDVDSTFDFFEWYLTYSQPDMTTLEPDYFWRDVALCYKYYTKKMAAESTSFPGLLDCLSHGLFISKGRRARFRETAVEKDISEIGAIRDGLKTTYEDNDDDVAVAERYILSNIILSNKMPDSRDLTLVTELQTIIQRFLNTEVGQRSPEFYLLVLLLFWPEVVQEEDDEEVEQQTTDENCLENKSWDDKDSDEEQETGGEPTQPPPDLQQFVTFMESAYNRKYAKYLRGRYLLPLFFLAKGSGLSKWIHKSKLDAIVEEKVDTKLAGTDHDNIMKMNRINEMWMNGEVWKIPEVKDILLPVQAVPWQHPVIPQKQDEQKMFVCAGGEKIEAAIKFESPAQSPVLFYLGFTIQGPFIIKVGVPGTYGQ
ncbi:sterile alpha motif domain-containing protein 9-like [Mastacembelus armatus]|uniref:sterile alpha motif domain-containing protein 9-like n=1 Tax=Mastacembelus armatus TaxID=205130 RepID=UPI000E45E25E|nr:sterile alpha motif domain-containing protein 9-like [Mastacembelus armatus]